MLPLHRRREPKPRALILNRKGCGTPKIAPPERVCHPPEIHFRGKGVPPALFRKEVCGLAV